MSVLESLVGGAVLRQGNAGPAVQVMQLALKELGYGLKANSTYFGPATDVAVRAFQRRAGLHPDGEVGEVTAKAIDKAVATAPHAPALERQALVVEVKRPLWLQAGIGLVGTKEFPGNADNPVIMMWAKDLGGDIGKEYTHDSIPWCALGVNHSLALAGLPGTGTLYALDFNADQMQRRLGHRWPGVRLSGPAVGAIAPMLRNGGGHVMMIVGKDQHGNVMGVGFNQSDACNIEPFARSRLNQGFWWPASVAVPALVGWDQLPVVTSNGKLSTNEA